MKVGAVAVGLVGLLAVGASGKGAKAAFGELDVTCRNEGKSLCETCFSAGGEEEEHETEGRWPCVRKCLLESTVFRPDCKSEFEKTLRKYFVRRCKNSIHDNCKKCFNDGEKNETCLDKCVNRNNDIKGNCKKWYETKNEEGNRRRLSQQPRNDDM